MNIHTVSGLLLPEPTISYPVRICLTCNHRLSDKSKTSKDRFPSLSAFRRAATAYWYWRTMSICCLQDVSPAKRAPLWSAAMAISTTLTRPCLSRIKIFDHAVSVMKRLPQGSLRVAAFSSLFCDFGVIDTICPLCLTSYNKTA